MSIRELLPPPEVVATPKLIHAHVYDPNQPNIFFKAKANDHAELHTVSCATSDRCELYARGECAARGFLSGCIYGRANRTSGPTKRSQSCRTWVRERKAETAAVGQLQSPVAKMARIGEHIWLPYSHIDIVLTGEVNLGSSWRQQFVLFTAFTAQLVAKICDGRPCSLFGGEITDYQRVEVPKFVNHLIELYPDLAREAAPMSYRLRGMMATLTKVGRKARVWTLLPNVGLFHGGASSPACWRWDGEALTTEDRRGFPPFTPFDAVEVRVVPGKDAVVVVTDDAQIGPNTILVD